MTPVERPGWQVRSAAGAMDRALVAGIGEARLLVLVAARRAWQDGRALSEAAFPGLSAALADPAAGEFDEVFIRAARRELTAG